MYEDIKEQFKKVISYSQGIDDPKVDTLFDMWMIAKEKFINMFGGLIYEWPEPIEFTLDEKDKKNKVDGFIDNIAVSYQNKPLADFIIANSDSFFDNIVKNNDDHEEIPKGMKLIKAFKYFEKDKDILSSIQDLASRYIQENKIKGKLCFSVHPLDFLSSSENTYKWRSCHALDGEFRAGNLSYMTDNVTFMVYVKGANDDYLPNFPTSVPWNSKKWRVLMHVALNNDIMFAGRQYPFSSKVGLDTALNIYNDMYMRKFPSTNVWSPGYKYTPWRNNYITHVPFGEEESLVPLNTRYLLFNHQLLDIEQVIIDPPGALNYNDLLSSSIYLKPYYTVLHDGFSSPHGASHLLSNPLNVGMRVRCLECDMDYIDDSQYMRCHSCELEYGDSDDDSYTYCSCCDTRLYYDDAYEVNGEMICDSCFSEECFICDNCGESHFNEDRRVIKVGEGDNVQILDICVDCEDEYTEAKEGKE